MEEEYIYFDNSTTAIMPKEVTDGIKEKLDRLPTSYARRR